MRSRNVKPGLFENEQLAECTPWARLLFVGLWMLADREGRLEDRPKRIKGALFAFDSIDVEPLLGELERSGFIARYAVEGRALIQVLNFTKHQNPHFRERASDLPPQQSPGLDSHPMPAEPEAPDGLNAAKASGLRPIERGSSLPVERGSSPADSLIPDSLIPDKRKSTRNRVQAFDASSIEIPSWLEKTLWMRWCEDRKQRRVKTTQEAARLQIERLETFRAEGYAPASVIDYAIASNHLSLNRPPGIRPARSRSVDLASMDFGA